MRILLITSLVALSACSNGPPLASDWRYDLGCDGLSTQVRGAVACLRLNSADGSVHFIDIEKLSTLGVSTADKASARNGRFKLACGVSNTPKEATMRCIRLDRKSGEMVSIDLSRLPRLPADAPKK